MIPFKFRMIVSKTRSTYFDGIEFCPTIIKLKGQIKKAIGDNNFCDVVYDKENDTVGFHFSKDKTYGGYKINNGRFSTATLSATLINQVIDYETLATRHYEPEKIDFEGKEYHIIKLVRINHESK